MKTFNVHGLYAQKIADVCEIPVEYVHKLRDKELLDEKKVRDKLIKNDFYALLKSGKLTEKQILDTLAFTYGMKEASILRIVKLKYRRIYYCKRCGKVITSTDYRRNDGMCGYCLSQQIII